MKEKLKVNPILSAILAFFVIHLFIFVIMIILSFIAFFVLRHELNPDLFTYHLLVIDYIFSASIFSIFYPIGWLVVY